MSATGNLRENLLCRFARSSARRRTLGLGGGSVCEAEPLECFVGEGFAIHSGPLDGLPTADAKAEIIQRLESLGLGKSTINFKLRDWLFSPATLLG